MAYAYTAICDDASANYYNAAGLASLGSPKITTDFCGYLPGLHPDMYYVYSGVGYPLNNSAWGFDATYYTFGRTDVYDYEGEYLGTSLMWGVVSKINYARRIAGTLSFGIGWKFIYSHHIPPWVLGTMPELGIKSGGIGSSWAFDFNILYKILSSVSIGTVMHNIGPDIKYSESGEGDPLPMLYRLGVAYKPVDNKNIRVTLSTELSKILVGLFAIEENSFWEDLKYELDETWKAIGLDITYWRIISLRTGYFYDVEGERRGFTFGAGLNFRNFELDIGIDENTFEFVTQNRKISLSYTG
jgi:hypothetical protein